MTVQHAPPSSGHDDDPHVGDQGWARAYCGPAHGHTWRPDASGPWPAVVVLDSRVGPQQYRLVHDLRAHRPARDDLGNTLYMPVPVSEPSRWGRTA